MFPNPTSHLKYFYVNYKVTSVPLWLIIAVVTLSAIGCSNKAAQASRELATTITRTLPVQSGGQNPDSPIEERRVYLDASISMQGFVNPTHHSQFDELIDTIGDTLPGCQLYKYGQKGKTPTGGNPNVIERINFGLELHRPDFYGLSYNPDDRLIEQLASEDRAVFSVLITDGVYSEPQGATAPPVVQAIRNWMSKGRVLGILSFKSAFDGPFYSERGRNILPKTLIKARPFYAFVFSPTVKAFRELQDKLKKPFPDMQTFLFSDEAVSCIPKINQKLKNTYSYKMPPEVPYYWHMFDDGLFAQHNPAPVGYNITCTIAPDYPVSQLKYDLATEYYRWNGKIFNKVVSGAPPGFRYDLAPNEKEVKANNEGKDARAKPTTPPPDFVVYFPKDTSGDYGFYYLTLFASPKSLHSKIEEASTRDDRLPGSGDKTFRFLELIDSLTNVHFKTRLASKASTAIFVTIDNH